MGREDHRRLAPVRDLLLPYRRPARRALGGWSADLARRVNAATGLEPLCTALNEAGLVFTHLGRSDIAAQICVAQLELVGKKSATAPGLAHLAFQPWVNLGRLAALSGNGMSAREHFDLWRRLQQGSTVTLGPCEITPDRWNCIKSADPGITDVLANIQVIDTLRSWFATGEFSAAQRFLADLEAIMPAHPGIREGITVCHVELGEHCEALECAASERLPSPFAAAILGLHLAPSIKALGDEKMATGQLLMLASAEQQDNWAVAGINLLRYCERLVTVLLWADCDKQAHDVARRCWQLSVNLGDEVSAHRACRTLETLSSAPEKARWRDEKVTLERNSCYQAIRRETPGPGLPAVSELVRSVSAALGADLPG